MALITLRGEKNLGEIADRLFVRLTPLQRQKVEAALLRANPRLAKPGRLPEGVIIDIPDLPELRAKASPELDNPDRRVASMVRDAVTEGGKTLEASLNAEIEQAKLQRRDLDRLRKDAGTANGPDLLRTASEAEKHIETRAKMLAERQEALSRALRLVLTDLKV